MHRMPNRRGSRDLTLVRSWVSFLRWLDLQRPVLGSRIMRSDESAIWCIRVDANSEQMNIPVPHPGHLRNGNAPIDLVEIEPAANAPSTSIYLVSSSTSLSILFQFSFFSYTQTHTDTLKKLSCWYLVQLAQSHTNHIDKDIQESGKDVKAPTIHTKRPKEISRNAFVLINRINRMNIFPSRIKLLLAQ